ncbi:hypothetical protein IFM46972_05994 [Aspergillus udagawae]|uniref:Methyltransferase-like protein 7B n=1 Tax=Aspergillus udagawae TaxID=91492 RepID=A0A8H3RVS7_9EURO|nr:hypothetical protein IFM46972_05994 [Aspergillus udagawae]
MNLGIFDLLMPVFVFIIAILYLPITLITLLKNRRFSDLTSWQTFRHAWFFHFWHFFGWASRPLYAPDVEKILSAARGVVIDVGSGSGDWLYLLSEARNKNIVKIYLVEPNPEFYPVLQRRVKELGLVRKCLIVKWVEDLEMLGVQPGTVYKVCTINVLCSVEDSKPLIKVLYQYLKPAGQWLVYEHVKAERRSVAGVLQEDLLLQSGKWNMTDLRPGANESSFAQMPHIVGILEK